MAGMRTDGTGQDLSRVAEKRASGKGKLPGAEKSPRICSFGLSLKMYPLDTWSIYESSAYIEFIIDRLNRTV